MNLLDRSAALAQLTRDAQVAELGPDLPWAPMVQAAVGERPWAVVLPKVDGDPLRACVTAAAALALWPYTDSVTVMLDMYTTSAPPGAPVPHGRPRTAWLHGDPATTEALMLAHCERGEAPVVRLLPYRCSGREVRWETPATATGDDLDVSGVVPLLARFWQSVEHAYRTFGPADAAEAHRDVIETLRREGHQVVLLGPG